MKLGIGNHISLERFNLLLDIIDDESYIPAYQDPENPHPVANYVSTGQYLRDRDSGPTVTCESGRQVKLTGKLKLNIADIYTFGRLALDKPQEVECDDKTCGKFTPETTQELFDYPIETISWDEVRRMEEKKAADESAERVALMAQRMQAGQNIWTGEEENQNEQEMSDAEITKMFDAIVQNSLKEEDEYTLARHKNKTSRVLFQM